MKLNHDIEELNTISDNQKHYIVSKRIKNVVKKLELLNTVAQWFDEDFGENMFHVVKINSSYWLFFNTQQLLLLTEKQAKNIEKLRKIK